MLGWLVSGAEVLGEVPARIRSWFRWNAFGCVERKRASREAHTAGNATGFNEIGFKFFRPVYAFPYRLPSFVSASFLFFWCLFRCVSFSVCFFVSFLLRITIRIVDYLHSLDSLIASYPSITNLELVWGMSHRRRKAR